MKPAWPDVRFRGTKRTRTAQSKSHPQDSDPDQAIESPSVAFRHPFGPLEEYPLGFCLGTLSEIGFDLFNQGSGFRRRHFEG
jgi:hypothetical protein